jgi:invasion protein IalB
VLLITQVAGPVRTPLYLGCANALLLAFALGSTLAMAQEVQPVPKTTLPNGGVAPHAKAAAASAATARAWIKLCKKSEQADDKQSCLVKYEAVNPTTGAELVSVSVRTGEGGDQMMTVGVTTAYTLAIPVDVQVKIDNGQPISLKYSICLHQACQAQTKLTKAIFDEMRKGKEMMVGAVNAQQKTMGFRVSLAGFGGAYDGPAVDNTKYAQSQRLFDQARQFVEQKKGEQQSTSPPSTQVPVLPPVNSSTQTESLTKPTP